MKYNYSAAITFAFLSLTLSAFGRTDGFYDAENSIKVEFHLETDTVRDGMLRLEKFSDNYFIITNENEKSICFNEVPILAERAENSNIKEGSVIFYFPRIEQYNGQSNSWENIDFYSLIGDSGDPLPLEGDNIICLEKGEKHEFKGMFVFNLMRFSSKGKYRLCLEVFYKSKNSILLQKSSNYHQLFVI